MMYWADINIVKLVSANKRIESGKNRFYSNSEYKTCKESLIFMFQQQAKKILFDKTFTKPCHLKLTLHAYMDTSNALKVIEDALEKAKIIKNDDLIREHSLKRTKIKRGSMDSFKLILEPIPK